MVKHGEKHSTGKTDRSTERKGNENPDRPGPPATALSPIEGTGEVSSTPPVVGIGASAGGLDAFSRLVGRLTDDTGLAYILVQHLDPVHQSMLPEILGRVAPVPVLVAEDGMRLRPDHVYIMPPAASMTVTDGHLRVVRQERTPGQHTVIDTFLQSLSEVHGSDAIGVILSGAGSDGSRGIEAIKERGGITLAQDAHSAQFPSMPESAAATGCIDFVLPPEGIAECLVQIGRLAVRGRPEQASSEVNRADIEAILLLLRKRTGIDFRHYRAGTVHRRILRRMLVHLDSTHEDYLAHLRADPAELDVLCEDLLIGVTCFFRDADAFTALQQTALPEMMKGRPAGAPVRIWVAGCSGGEEAYSVVISLLEYLGDAASDTEVQLFGTDLSEAAIARARAGLYAHRIEDDVSPERLRRFFVREENGYRVSRQVRDVCVFARHNLVQDPPFSQLDLVTCRNVLIYFDAVLQQRAMESFHYGLNPNGVLLLGGAESAGPQYFAPLDKQHKLFRPQPRTRRPVDVDVRVPLSMHSGHPPRPDPHMDRLFPQTVQQDADRAVLGRLAPPGVVINERLEIIQFRGDTTEFLQHPSGVASLHLLKLLRPEFLPRLRAAVEQAGVDAQAVREERVVLRDGDAVRHVSVEVIPFRSGQERERFFVILFDANTSEPVDLSSRTRKRARAGVTQAASAEVDAGAKGEIAQLREALVEAKRYLQDVIEQYEAANEELRAATEETESSNEELRSTNEELETTKEEVQSTNEELTTVNEELRHRNRELAAISGDLANVFASTQIPIVIVDGTLALRRFTPVASRVMKVIPSDIGRPLGDIKLRIDLPDLDARVVTTIETLEPSQVDVRDDEGWWWALTIRPYLTIDRKVDGAVLVFTDIDAAKKYGEQADETLKSRQQLLLETEQARAEANAANLTKMVFLANMSHDLRTPLNAIAGYADLMEIGVHGTLTQDQQRDVARIKGSSRHLLSLINDILNFAKVGTGHLDLHIVPIPVAEVLATLEEIVSPQAGAKALSLELHDCAGTVLADPEKLQQVLLNLVTNAIKFTTMGGVSVRCAADDSTVRITVSDTGAGIPSDQLGRIFEPFIQVNRSLTNGQQEGVGLGLSISRDLARAMKGDITVESVVGEGSTFTLTLPSSNAGNSSASPP